MAYTKFLQPDELVQYEYPDDLEVGGEYCKCYVTDRRILLYRSAGWWFWRSESVSARRISDVIEISYSESGIFTKTVTLEVQTSKKSLLLKGSWKPMQQLYQELQQFTSD